MNRSATSQGGRIASNVPQRLERKDSNCDMPRQMPSEIDRQIKQETEAKQQKNRLLDIPNFNSVVDQSQR